MAIKRFLLFAGAGYYPEGGWSDFIGAYDSQEEAAQAYDKLENKQDWYQIVDLEQLKVVQTG